MIRMIRCAALALMLMPAMSSAQDFDAAMAAYKAGEYSTAWREMYKLAEQGDGAAQLNLGNMFAEGQGVPPGEVVRLN